MSESEPISEEAVEQGGPRFDPPLYIQRYTTVKDILYKVPGIGKIVDLGCSEGKFIKYLKNLPFATEISCVDVHKPSLYLASQVSRPAAWDFLFKRYKDLSIRIFHGSVLDKDIRLYGYNAVTCIELIEHLNLTDLETLASNVFSFIHPKIAIFTTPNCEFNVLFPQVKDFRHWDHKFEWTRLQFMDWCESIIKQYPDYYYEIGGIGDPPSESSDLGCCTQMAVFKLDETTIRQGMYLDYSKIPYTLLEEHVYPGRNES